jgi:WD40 repeat protein
MMDIFNEKRGTPVQVFYSYAPADEDLLEKLEIHLSMLKRQGLLADWHAHKILPGTHRRLVQNEHFISAQLVLLLISPTYLASDPTYSEMQAALQRQQRGLVRALPILLKPVDLELVPFAHLQMLPRNSKPVTLWSNRDLAFVDITRGIRAVLEHMVGPNDPNNSPSSSFNLATSPLLFLSHALSDLPQAERLREALAAQDIIGWLGPTDLTETAAMERREAIQQALAVVVLASPSTRLSRQVKQELKLAEIYQRPILLFWLQGNTLIEVTPADQNNLPVFDAREQRYPQALHDLLRDLQKIMHSTRQIPLRLPSSSEPRNPYKGLQAFGLADSADFFGRDQMIATILTSIQQITHPTQQEGVPPRLLTILGPSGSGKSSIVMAGVLPQIKRGMLPGSEEWILLDPLLPGKHPIEALIRVLAPLYSQRSLKSLREDLEDDTARGLHLLLTAQVKQPEKKVVLFIDQFEELLTQTNDEDAERERQLFIDLLLLAIAEPGGPLLVLLTLRADFYGRPLSYPNLEALIKQQHCLVSAMQVRDLRAIIEQPARLPDVRVSFEDELVGDLLFEIQGQMHALPLLEFTLTQLFEKREGRLLTLRAYERIGRVKGALAEHATKTYEQLPTPDHQRLACALFRRLINVGIVEQEVTRRRVPTSELVMSQQEDTDLLLVVRTTFINARLLTANTVGETSTLEISHEALIDAWPLLKEWLGGAHETMLLQQTINRDAAEWFRYNKPVDRFYRGEQLKEALAWRKNTIVSLDEDTFLQASFDASQKAHQRTIRRALLLSLLGIAGMGGTGVVVKVLAGNTPSSPELVSTAPNIVSQSSTGFTYTGHTSGVTCVAWSPNGKYVASGSFDQKVKIWNATNGQFVQIYREHKSTVESITWSPDSTRVASCSNDKTVQIWNASTGEKLLMYNDTASVSSVAWSPDGSYIASANFSTPGILATIQVWNATTGEHLLTYRGHSTSIVYGIAWSSDGKYIVSCGSDQTAQVWSASTGTRLFTYKSHRAEVLTVAWSPHDMRIASGSSDTTVQIWNATTGKNLLTYRQHADAVYSVAWSHDGMRIASGSSDKTAQVWDVATGSHIYSHAQQDDAVNSLTWSPDGTYIASANGIAVQIWKTFNLLNYTKHTGLVYSAAWSQNGKYIASSGSDKTVQIWNASTGSYLFTCTGHQDTVNTVAWSPDNTRIASASGGSDQTVQLWDAATGSHLLTYKTYSGLRSALAYSGLGNTLTWSPDGTRIASADSFFKIQIWDASTGTHLFDCSGHTYHITCVAWSPDGARIASGSEDGTIQIWNASTGTHIFTYPNDVTYGDRYSIAWSSDSTHIASARSSNPLGLKLPSHTNSKGAVHVWNVGTGSQSVIYTGHTGAVNNMMWSPDGTSIASASEDNTVHIWNASTGTHRFTYREHIAPVFSVMWSPDGKFIASAGDETVRVWWAV